MTRHWKCCCGCQAGGPFKAGIISYTAATGHNGSQKGGFKSTFEIAGLENLVDEILSASSDTQGDGEKEDALMSVIQQSCVLAIGSTDWGQVDGGNPNWARSPSQDGYSESHFFIPDISAGEGTFEAKVTDAVIEKVCKEGALLVILGGNPDNIESEYTDEGGCGENWGESFICGDNGSTGTGYCNDGINHVDKINDFLDKMREHGNYKVPTGYDKIVYGHSKLKEHGDYYGSDLHNDVTISNFISCNTTGADCDGEECGDFAGCDVCGPYGGVGREIHMHWNYNLFKVGLSDIDSEDEYYSATWLNDPEEDDYDNLLHLQDQLSGSVSGGRWIHDKENIDGYEIVQTGYALEKFGKGYVLIWGCPTTFMGDLGGNSYNSYNFGGFNCALSSSACYDGNNAPVRDDNYGHRPYKETSYLLSRIIDRIIGKEVEALV